MFLKSESFFSESDWTRSRGAIVSVSSDGAADTPHLRKRDVSKRNLPDTWLWLKCYSHPALRLFCVCNFRCLALPPSLPLYHTHTHARTHAHTHTHTHAHTHAHTHTHARTHARTHTHTHGSYEGVNVLISIALITNKKTVYYRWYWEQKLERWMEWNI